MSCRSRSRSDRADAGGAVTARPFTLLIVTETVVRAPFGRETIESIIPHRDPFLFLDEIVELDPGVSATALKTIRGDEWFLPGHFPGRPIVPGVIMVEALAQTAAVAVLAHPDHAGKLALFAGIDDVRFKRIVVPGDVLTLVVTDIHAVRGPIGRGKVTALVGDEVAVRGSLMFAAQ